GMQPIDGNLFVSSTFLLAHRLRRRSIRCTPCAPFAEADGASVEAGAVTFHRRGIIAALAMAAFLAGCVRTSAIPVVQTSLDRGSLRHQDIVYSDFLYVNAGCGIPPASGICIFTFPHGKYVGWIEHYTGSAPYGLC